MPPSPQCIRQPGPQPANRLAATAESQLARAHPPAIPDPDDRAALLSAIAADAADDGRRLVYADWLADHADGPADLFGEFADRAALVRSMVLAEWPDHRVELSSYRGYERWRYVRLGEALAAVPGRVAVNLESLHDDKGTLTVTWSRRPTLRERTALAAAWAALGEPAAAVRHEVAAATRSKAA